MHILICDDELEQRELLAGFLRKSGYTVTTAGSGNEAIALNRQSSFDLAILDLKMPGMDGIETLEQMKRIDPQTYFIILTGFGTVDSAVTAMKQGAFDYLGKPVNLDELEIKIKRIYDEQMTRGELRELQDVVGAEFRPGSFVAASAPMKKILETIPRIARSDASVLLLGESGTGKEMVARMIHDASARRGNRFVAISCAALPETLIESELFGYERGAFTGADRRKIGKFEIANRGTLLLDEIGDLPLAVQVKLLRVLQEFSFERLGSNAPVKVDVRLVCATNQNLKRKIAAGAFREDLLYRLNVITITLPPLRDRREDIAPLAELFIRRYGERAGKAVRGITREGLNVLVRYDWPGNVRELENVIERAVVLCRREMIEPPDLPLDRPIATGNDPDTLAVREREHIVKVLQQTRWNMSETARRLGIHRNTLRLKVKEYGIERPSAGDEA